MKNISVRMSESEYKTLLALSEELCLPVAATVRHCVKVRARMFADASAAPIPAPRAPVRVVSSPEEVEAKINALFADDDIEGDEPPAGFDPYA